MAEGPREVRLVGKAAGQGDLRKLRGAFDHEPLRPFDAPTGHEPRKRDAKCPSKASREVARAETRVTRRHAQRGPGVQVGVNKLADPFDLPWQQAFPALAFLTRRRALPGSPFTGGSRDIWTLIKTRAAGGKEGRWTRRVRVRDRWTHHRKVLGLVHGSSPAGDFT
jgi:hypothetical protein